MIKLTIWILSMVVIVFFLMESDGYPNDINKVAVHQMDSNTWMATDKKINVTYRSIDCPVIAENVLKNVVDDSNAGVFEWSRMQDIDFRFDTLYSECIRLRSEMKRLKDINNKK
jgi:hypothetical protein